MEAMLFHQNKVHARFGRIQLKFFRHSAEHIQTFKQILMWNKLTHLNLFLVNFTLSSLEWVNCVMVDLLVVLACY